MTTTTHYFINQNASGDIVFRTTADGYTFTDALTISGATGTASIAMATATTEPPGTSNNTIATTAFVTTADNLKANLASPTFTGTPSLPTGTIAVTQSPGNSTTAIATTAFVTTADNLKANLASPTFTGTPSLPTGTIAVTQTAGTSNTTIATTAFATTADNLKANLASPTFTGTPSLPTGTIAVTQSPGDSSTAIATTAFVTTADNLKANLASPTFTGTPSLPTGTIGVTQTAGTSNTTIATTAFVTTADNLKANLASPTFTGSLTAVTISGQLLVTGTASSTITGTATPSTGTVNLTGSGTSFTTQLVVGDRITINGETKTVVTISSNIALTVDTNFTTSANSTVTRLPGIDLLRSSIGTTVGIVDSSGGFTIGPLNASNTVHQVYGGQRQKQVAGSAETATVVLEQKDTTPGNPSATSEIKMYAKSNKLVFQYNDAGTVRYKYLDMTGTGVTWVHTTTAP